MQWAVQMAKQALNQTLESCAQGCVNFHPSPSSQLDFIDSQVGAIYVASNLRPRLHLSPS